MRKSIRRANEKGFTLIELLAVVVILGIIALIAVISIGGLIERAKKDAFVHTAYTLKEAAEYYAKDQHVQEQSLSKITYQLLYKENMIEKIKDPFSKAYLDPDTNDSYIIVEGLSAKSVCLIGSTKNICSNGEGNSEEYPVPFDDLSINNVQENK
ncbi:type II secretion system protein [Heyndrickxia vini]|uniref:type II secretion system protein n=1 Tax=Heyndrickxia vini TaxID=1476025 RepID=UPI001FE77AF2|nr:type II secretion system protein [Heyndrickxia vini]